MSKNVMEVGVQQTWPFQGWRQPDRGAVQTQISNA